MVFICLLLTELGSRKALDAIVPTDLPVFSFLPITFIPGCHLYDSQPF
jgi:hypothetical protein